MKGIYTEQRKNVFAMQRGWHQHPIFKNEPFSDREAWMWLIENARFSTFSYRFRSTMYKINRGEVPTNYREMITVWKWGQSRVKNFLELLESEGMISTKTDTGFLIISICNYDKYQYRPRETDTVTDTEPDTQSDTVPDTVVDTVSDTYNNKDNKINKENNAVCDAREAEPPSAHTQENFSENSDFEKWKEVLPDHWAIAQEVKPHFSGKQIMHAWGKLVEFNSQGIRKAKLPGKEKWREWLGRERDDNLPKEAEATLTGRMLEIQQMGILNWKRRAGKPITQLEEKRLQAWEAKEGIVWWINIGEYEEKQGKAVG